MTHQEIMIRFPVAIDLLLQRGDDNFLFTHFGQQLFPLLDCIVSFLLNFPVFYLLIL